VTQFFPRELTTLERSLLHRLLAEEFPGAIELRVQAEAVRVKGYGGGLPSILLLEADRRVHCRIDRRRPRSRGAFRTFVTAAVIGTATAAAIMHSWRLPPRR